MINTVTLNKTMTSGTTNMVRLAHHHRPWNTTLNGYREAMEDTPRTSTR